MYWRNRGWTVKAKTNNKDNALRMGVPSEIHGKITNSPDSRGDTLEHSSHTITIVYAGMIQDKDVVQFAGEPWFGNMIAATCHSGSTVSTQTTPQVFPNRIRHSQAFQLRSSSCQQEPFDAAT